ncbi:MAG: D-2-hydroxyacid dehydrogenase family protein [Cellvibrionaceae bacterium]
MKLAILDDYQKVAFEYADWSQVKTHCEVFRFNSYLGSEEDIVEALESFTIICCMRERTSFSASVLKRLPNLKLLVTTGAKNAAIDLKEAEVLGILVCGTQSPGHAAAELAWALLMSLAKNLHIEDQQVRQGQWQTKVGTDLKGQVLGIVGLGRHGENVARFAKAFGMTCIAWSQNLEPQRCEALGVQYVDKETLFRTADMISVHLKMGQRNRSLISKAEFKLMKKTVILVNTSRGPIIDEAALLDALAQKRIRGVGLDVYNVEPLPTSHPLLLSDRVLLSPHIGYVTEQTYDVFYSQTVDAVLAWLNKKPIRTLN